MRFRQLQAFHAIIETGTVTSAAEHLGISQPGISNLLSQLEHSTRVPLFVRDRGRLVPTPEAALLYREVDTLVRGFDHVAQAVSDLQNKQVGQLQVASQHAMSFGFMPPLIAEFARTRPDMSISFQSQYSTKIQEWIMAGLFEIGICETPIQHDGLSARLFQTECRIALPEGHPLADCEVLTPPDLREVPFIAMGAEHLTHRRTREAFEEAGVPWRPRIHTHLFRNVLSFVQQGLGVAVLDCFALDYESSGGFVSRPFRPLITLDLAIVTSRTRPLSMIGRAFLDLLIERVAPLALNGISKGGR